LLTRVRVRPSALAIAVAVAVGVAVAVAVGMRRRVAVDLDAVEADHDQLAVDLLGRVDLDLVALGHRLPRVVARVREPDEQTRVVDWTVPS
jgi:hypothetical protein